MVNPIIDLEIYSSELVNDNTKIIFSFTKPAGDIGGYYLLQSSTGLSYTHIHTRIDESKNQDESLSTYDEDDTVYYEYTCSDSDKGKLLYYKIVVLSPIRATSADSNIVTIYTFPSYPDNVFCEYNGFSNYITWDSISFDSINDTFIEYEIRRRNSNFLKGFDFDSTTDTISHTSLIKNKFVKVIDVFKRSIWFGKIETDGEFSLTSTNKIQQASDSTETDITKDRLQIFVESSEYDSLGTTTSTGFIDTTYDEGVHYIYEICSIALGDRENYGSKSYSFTVAVTKTFPYLRPPENSDTPLLNNPYWTKLKKTLVDSNYYNLSAFAIPFSDTTVFNLKGYLGVSKCNVDLYVNDIYTLTTSTGVYGEFNINYKFPKGDTRFRFQARDSLNINFSMKSQPYKISTLNIYTLYSLFGSHYKQIEQEISDQILDTDITQARYSSFEDRYAPLVQLYKSGDEDEAKFRDIASVAFKSFEYVGYEKALYDVLDVFKKNIDTFEHYELYLNNSLYQTHRTMYIPATQTGDLERDDYYYGLSAFKYTGEETPVSTIRVDRRWWPFTYKGFNYFIWTPVAGAESYRIYRGTSEDNLQLLATVPGVMFVDDGHLTPTSTGVVSYNFTNLDIPDSFRVINDVRVSNYIMKLKKPTSMVIILFAYEDTEISDLNINRLLILFSKIIPPEIRYTILYIRNSKIIIYPEEEEITPPDDLVKGLYNHSFYDSGYMYY